MDRRRFALTAALLPLIAIQRQALAQSKPPSLIKILVGFPPGGAGFDFIARQVASQLPEPLGGGSIVVENRVGASGRIALVGARNAKPDGGTLVLSPQGAMTIFPHIYANLGFDPSKDFSPISRLVTFDYTVTVGPDAPVTSIAQFVELLKSNAAKRAFASPGGGTTPHFIGEAFFQRIGLPALHVPYKGGAPALLDVIAGRVPVQFDTVSAAIENHRAGKVRVLATLGTSRSAHLPEVPTLKELGIDLTVSGWCGLYGPAGMDVELQSTLSKAVGTALMTASVREAFLKVGLTSAPSTPAGLAELQQRELAMWGPIVQRTGFKAES